MDPLKWALTLKQNSSEPLLQVFFHRANFKFLNDTVSAAVNKSAGMAVARQDPKAMLNLMMRVYDDFNRSRADLRQNLALINTRFSNLATAHILSGMNDYKHYYKAASTLAVPNAHPKNVSSKGDKILRNANNLLI